MKHNRPFRRVIPVTSVVAALTVGLLGEPFSTAPANAQWPELRAAGGKDALYVMHEANGDLGRETRVWMRQIDQGFRRPRRTDRQPPGVAAATVCRGYLHLFFENGSHQRVSPSGSAVQLVLPGRVKPLCVGGDPTEEVLYAIAEVEVPSTAPYEAAAIGPAATRPSSRSVQPVTTNRGQSLPMTTSQARTDTQLPTPTPLTTASQASPLFAMYRFHRGQWTRVALLPPQFKPTAGHLICTGGGQVHLFSWAPHQGQPVWYRCWAECVWGQAEKIPVPPKAVPSAAMVLNRSPVLVTLSSPEPGRTEVLSLYRDGSEWQTVPIRAAADAGFDVASDRLRVASYHDCIALVGRLGKKGQLQVGLWSPTSGAIKEPPRPLPRWPERAKAPLQPRLPQVAVFVILGAVIALTLWWRQESLTRTVELPTHLELAELWRRVTASLIDLAPALVITAVYWLPLVLQLRRDVALEDLSETEVAERYGVFLWPWLYARILYAAYCGLAEYRWGTTPGKRLMRLRVVTLDLTRPALKQVVIRNGIKILELQVPDLIALLVFVVLTRNRQRLGDVLAGTTVVQLKTAVDG